MSELVTGSTSSWRDYIMAEGRVAAIRYVANGQASFTYPLTDHLDSVAALVDGNPADATYGQIIDRYSYDAFGQPRDPASWAPDGCKQNGPQPPFVRGFLDQEHLPEGICVVNLNARLYDPEIGRFLSADPTVEAVTNLQDLNRYSYALNQPLSLSDPGGYGGFFGSIFSEIAGLAVAAVIGPEVLPFLEAQAGIATTNIVVAANAGIAGGMSGAVATGRLKGALLGAGEAVAMAGVHFLKTDEPGFWQSAVNVTGSEQATSAIAHGLVGGLFSIGQKGGFQAGFIAGGLSDLAATTDSPDLNGYDLVKNATVGGIGALLGGGKFENGATTGAFGYLFSEAMHGGGPQSMQTVDMSGAFDDLGKIWDLPDTVIGLTAGVASLPFGSDITLEHNAIVFNDFPWGSGGAITLGNVILTTEDSLDINIPSYSGRDLMSIFHLPGSQLPDSMIVDMGTHEEGHTYQFETLGPLFFPAYLAISPFSSSSPFESSADVYSKTGKGWWPW